MYVLPPCLRWCFVLVTDLREETRQAWSSGYWGYPLVSIHSIEIDIFVVGCVIWHLGNSSFHTLKMNKLDSLNLKIPFGECRIWGGGQSANLLYQMVNM
jgi:hypothetical protein